MEQYMLKILTDPGNRQKPGGVLGKLSAACYNYYLIHRCPGLNPFNTESLKFVKKGLLAKAAPFVAKAQHAPPLSGENLRSISSHIHNEVLKSSDNNVRARALRNHSALQLGMFTGARGKALLATVLEDFEVGADDDSPFNATVWWVMRKQKNDPDGEKGPVAEASDHSGLTRPMAPGGPRRPATTGGSGGHWPQGGPGGQ